MNEKDARHLAQTIRSFLPMLDVSARSTLIVENYHVFIKLPSKKSGFIMHDFEDWHHFQTISSLLSCSLLSAPLPHDIRPRFQHNNRWIEGLHLEPLPPDEYYFAWFSSNGEPRAQTVDYRLAWMVDDER